MDSAASLHGSFALSTARAPSRASSPAMSETQSDKAMRKFTCSSTQVCGFDPAKMVVFLRAEYPRDTAKEVAKALNIKSPRTVENWLNRSVFPSGAQIGAMIEMWGARFLFHTMLKPPSWVSDAARVDEYAALARKRDAIHSKYRTA